VHDILTKVPVPRHVKVGPEMIPELATLLALNRPALRAPVQVRDPVQASGPVVVKLVIFAEVPQLRVPVPIALTLLPVLNLADCLPMAFTKFPVLRQADS
jgi:hypothetical protein